MSEKTKIQLPKELSDFSWQPQTEVLEVAPGRPQRLFIGIPKEATFQESRVGLVPHSVATLVAHGHRVVVESGAGQNSRFSDHEYSEVGAEIAHDRERVFQADLLVKIAPPTLEEIDLFRPNQILISPIHLPTRDAEYLQKLQKKRVIALAMEYIRDESGLFPFVHIMSEIAGTSAILIAGELLSNINGGRGVLLGGIAGVPPAKVIILGAGVVAEFATRTALGLGAEVRIFDSNVYKLMRLQNRIGRQLHTSIINPIHLKEQLKSAQVAIGAIHSAQGRAPMIVSEEMVASMKAGTVIVDVSIDQGGCFETSRLTNHDKPTFEKHGIIHYCVPNIASRVSRTASVGFSNILTSMLLKTEAVGSMEALIGANPGLRNGVYTYKGCLTNTYLGARFSLKTTSLDLLITSNL
jgi:alanine dehydrogenase